MGPLAGFRIIEMAGIGPAPFAAMLFSDMGAEVIRVDRREAADLGLPGREPKFDVLNRGRKSISVDVKADAGRDVVKRLVARADAIIEGFRPGVMERLGLGPDVLLEANPKLVFGRMTGFGQDGPLANAAGHDINYIALAGPLHAIGRHGEAPVPPLNLVGDFGGGGMFLAFAARAPRRAVRAVHAHASASSHLAAQRKIHVHHARAGFTRRLELGAVARTALPALQRHRYERLFR
jgi:alpha-methylacyl-CoA racemase